MKGIKPIALIFIVAVSGIPSAWAQTGCPDITGSWGATYEEVVDGSTVAGVASLNISGGTIDYWLSESTLGQVTTDFATGSYSVDQWCSISWNYSFSDSGESGLVTGVIVNPDKMYLILGSAAAAASGRLVVERMTAN